MPTPPLSDEVLIEAIQYYNTHGGYKQGAKAAGIPRNTFKHRVIRALERGLGEIHTRTRADGWVPPELPSEVRPVHEIVASRRDTWNRVSAHHDATRLIPLKITTPGPIGIAHFGDLHLDDDGTNFPAVEEHTKIVMETEGMYAGCVGDTANNWVGRLSYLYADQSTTARESWELVRWWVEWVQPKLLYLIEGNHDCWAHNVNRVSPLEWIISRANSGIRQLHGARFEIKLPSGKSITLNARHDFKGHSQWNVAHPISKAAQMGFRDSILVAGHRHVSGYNVVKDPATALVSHAIQIASYKQVDDYAHKGGLPDQAIFECPVTIIDLDWPDPRHQVLMVPSPEWGKLVLTARREQWKQRRAR